MATEGPRYTCVYYNNLKEGDYAPSHDFFSLLQSVLMQEIIYLYGRGVRHFVLVGDGVDTAHFADLLGFTMDQYGYHGVSVTLMGMWADHENKKTPRAGGMHGRMTEIYRVTPAAALEEQFRKALEGADILLLVDKDRESSYYSRALEKNKAIHFFNPLEPSLCMENGQGGGAADGMRLLRAAERYLSAGGKLRRPDGKP